jgi:hypothetical protein
MTKNTPYKGVTYKTKYRKWHAKVGSIECGYADTDREAAKLRDKKIIALNLNVPLQVYTKVS